MPPKTPTMLPPGQLIWYICHLQATPSPILWYSILPCQFQIIPQLGVQSSCCCINGHEMQANLVTLVNLLYTGRLNFLPWRTLRCCQYSAHSGNAPVATDRHTWYNRCRRNPNTEPSARCQRQPQLDQRNSVSQQSTGTANLEYRARDRCPARIDSVL